MTDPTIPPQGQMSHEALKDPRAWAAQQAAQAVQQQAAARQVPAGQGVPDPSSLPEGHPLRKLGTSLGMVRPVTDPHEALAPHHPARVMGQPQEPQEPPVAASQPPQGPPAHMTAAQSILQAQRLARQQDAMSRAPDPLSRPYYLPSGGLPYEGHDGTVILAPMRGEQMEIVAGAGGGLQATPALRHIVQACTDTRGIPYEDLLLEDWVACLMHVLALSLGTDYLPLAPMCENSRCKLQFDGSRSLSAFPCRVLRRPGPGEEITWPPATTQDEDEDLRILREMGLAGDGNDHAQQVYFANGVEGAVVELSNRQRIGWRYLQLRDMVQAFTFAERSQNTNVSIGARLGRFIQACYMVSIDDRPVMMMEAMEWVRQAPLFLQDELREAIGRRSFGYELSPMFRCTHCGHRFRQQLPLDAAMFRRHRGSAFA